MPAEAILLFANGDPGSARLIPHDLVNATVGFEALAEEIHKPARSLHRMLPRSDNPTMSNISAVFAAIHEDELKASLNKDAGGALLCILATTVIWQ